LQTHGWVSSAVDQFKYTAGETHQFRYTATAFLVQIHGHGCVGQVVWVDEDLVNHGNGFDLGGGVVSGDVPLNPGGGE
jgi:hypothetical protein